MRRSTYEITTDGHKESVVVGNIAYTGWKLIGVVPESVQTARINNFRYYIFTTIMVLMMMLLEGNRLISEKYPNRSGNWMNRLKHMKQEENRIFT